MDYRTLAIRAGILVALAGSVAVIWRIDRPQGRWGTRLRSRLLLGVPWGTLVVMGVVLSVYLFVQRGIDDWHGPLVMPFYQWSYLYPVGVLTAPLSHANAGHVTGNLLGTAVLAPLAEYAWSHFPTRRGSSSFGSRLENPYVRAFVVFPLGVLGVAYCTTLFHWGPVIGFSGAVYAFAGFSLVRYPLATVIAVAARELVDLLYRAWLDPIDVTQSSPTFSEPAFANIAVQGHLLGIVLGALLGFLVISRREERPSALRIWIGGVLLGTGLSVWVLWWYRGPDTYVLYRGLGVVVVVAFALLVGAAVRTATWSIGDLTGRQVATALFLVPLLTMAGVAVPVNLTTVDDPPAVDQGVHVGGYTVTYATDVRNPKTSIFDGSMLGETATVETSGVIVSNDDREVWVRRVSPGELSFRGYAVVRVGGFGWQERIVAVRTGWKPVGNDTVYQVSLRTDEEMVHAYASDEATARPVIAGRNVTIVPHDGNYSLVVDRAGRSLGRVGIPAAGENVTVGGLRFVREDERLVGVVDDTRVTVARKETYN